MAATVFTGYDELGLTEERFNKMISNTKSEGANGPNSNSRNVYSRPHSSQFNPRQVLRLINFPPYLRRSSKQILYNHGYEITNNVKLGYGRYSKVCEGIIIKSGVKIAIKIIDKSKVTEEFKMKFLPREIECWKQLKHRNLVELFDTFEENGKVFFPMELAENGDLLTFVQKNGAQKEALAQEWMSQLVSAIYYIHMKKMAHRDLKLENILLFADNSVKIADFGFCREADYDHLSTTFCGSKSYSAPEILLGHAYPPFKADVWSLGVVAFVLVTNRMPFNERVSSNTIIVECQRNRSYHYSKSLCLTNECQTTIDALMTFDYEERPNIEQVVLLPWFRAEDN